MHATELVQNRALVAPSLISNTAQQIDGGVVNSCAQVYNKMPDDLASLSFPLAAATLTPESIQGGGSIKGFLQSESTFQTTSYWTPTSQSVTPTNSCRDSGEDSNSSTSKTDSGEENTEQVEKEGNLNQRSLTDSMVLEIFAQRPMRSSTENTATKLCLKLAKHFFVSESAIRYIWCCRTWVQCTLPKWMLEEYSAGPQKTVTVDERPVPQPRLEATSRGDGDDQRLLSHQLEPSKSRKRERSVGAKDSQRRVGPPSASLPRSEVLASAGCKEPRPRSKAIERNKSQFFIYFVLWSHRTCEIT